jgi:hypothetical protein
MRFPNPPMTQDGHFVGIAATPRWMAGSSTLVLMSMMTMASHGQRVHKFRVACALEGL